MSAKTIGVIVVSSIHSLLIVARKKGRERGRLVVVAVIIE
jgi:hypothetical protein